MATMTFSTNSDMRFALNFSSHSLIIFRQSFRRNPPLFRLRAFSSHPNADDWKVQNKPPICTADELHYVNVANSHWRLALWRYHPHPKACRREHPLLLLSGVGTNAVAYDLSPESSFARHMSGQGFDTWILEVRGAGLSMQAEDAKDVEKSAHAISSHMEHIAENATKPAVDSTGNSSDDESDTSIDSNAPSTIGDSSAVATMWDESQSVMKLTETFMRLSERLSGFLSEAQSRFISAKLFDPLQKLLEDSQLLDRFEKIRGKFMNSFETYKDPSGTGEIKDLSQMIVNVFEEGQRSVSLPLFDLQQRFFTTIEDFQKQLDMMLKYDWDFDHYLEEDVPAVMEYIRAQTKPKDDKLFAIGHSMGGILLYSFLSRCGSEGRDPKLAAIVTLASSLDYTTSKSSLKLLIPFANPAQLLKLPIVPLGAMLSASYPLSSSLPYASSWLYNSISAEGMMDAELLKKLVLTNFCTIPTKLLLQLTTAFQEGGLRDRSGTFLYKDHLHKSSLPVLALAGDQDLICPPEAVLETAKLVQEHLVTYKVLGQPGGPHYAHYDLVTGRLAVEEVYPCIVEFLSRYDK